MWASCMYGEIKSIWSSVRMYCIKQEMPYTYLDFKSTAEEKLLGFYCTILRTFFFLSFWRDLGKLHGQKVCNNTGTIASLKSVFSRENRRFSRHRTLWYMKCLAFTQHQVQNYGSWAVLAVLASIVSLFLFARKQLIFI